MKTNIKMVFAMLITGSMLVATSASAHRCEFPETHSMCAGKKIMDKKCHVKKMSKKECEDKGGTYIVKSKTKK